jgi:hypothetical protein
MATGLLDVAFVTEEVAGVRIAGVSALGISYLLARFPEFRMMLTGREVKVDQLMTLAPDAIAAVIACGCGVVPTGKEGDEKRQHDAEAKAASIPIGVQADFLEAILRVTMPQGVGPFVARLERLAAEAEEGFGKVQATNSQAQSSNAPGPVSPQS